MLCDCVDMAMTKQRPVIDEATESDIDSDIDDSLSMDSSPFASPRQMRAQALITSASAFELASMADDDSNGHSSLMIDWYIMLMSFQTCCAVLLFVTFSGLFWVLYSSTSEKIMKNFKAVMTNWELHKMAS